MNALDYLLNDSPVYWGNSRCIKVAASAGKVFFLTWAGGFTYTTSQEQWDSGQITEVN